MQSPSHTARPVAIWLLCVAALICAMILLGGATRLTGSGLSMTQWRPITGIVPPLSAEDWHAAFALYRQIPEYRLVNPDMDMAGFQRIYWWEWSHRAFGRLIGLAFLLPLAWFALRRQLSRPLFRRLAVIFLLGALQGVIGWYMVASGLHGRVDVDPYRLALHLGMAFLLLGLCLHTALALLRPTAAAPRPRQQWLAGAILLAIFAQILLGALVAGGRGDVLPPSLAQGIALPSPQANAFWLALHQSLAYTLVAAILLYAGLARAATPTRLSLAAAILLQAGLGIFALVSALPLAAGLLHQAGAMLVFLLAVAHFHALQQQKA